MSLPSDKLNVFASNARVKLVVFMFNSKMDESIDPVSMDLYYFLWKLEKGSSFPYFVNFCRMQPGAKRSQGIRVN